MSFNCCGVLFILLFVGDPFKLSEQMRLSFGWSLRFGEKALEYRASTQASSEAFRCTDPKQGALRLTPPPLPVLSTEGVGRRYSLWPVKTSRVKGKHFILGNVQVDSIRT